MRKPASKKQIAITIGLLLALLAAGTWWAPHIQWAYLASRNGWKLDRVKVVEMPPAKPRTGAWFKCQASSVSFQLPPAMAEEAERTVAKAGQSLLLTTETHTTTLFIPMEIRPEEKSIVSHVASEFGMTPLQFVAESFRTSTDDFRWTMGRSELHRFRSLLGMSNLYPHYAIFSVETFSDPTMEGLLIVDSAKAEAVYEWRLNSGKSAGVIRFSAKKGELDLDELRTIARSVECDESKLSGALSNDQLGVLADTMKIELE
jgi:hypothetical protein